MEQGVGTMKLELPEEVIRRAEITARELRLLLAVQLYADHRIDYHDACRMAEVVPAILDRELSLRNISILRYPPLGNRRRMAG
jgi:predicted HTH domain antitoxin